MSAPTVGLALIVRDEERSLPTLLASVEGAFDEVVLVDTGSKDRTVPTFIEWAKAQDGLQWQVKDFEWCDDFAAARAYADSFLTTDWTCWADADDILQGAENLRGMAAQAPPELAAYVASYDYAQDHHGNTICVLRRERLVRRGRGTWWGRVHEAQLIDGPTTMVDPGIVQWVHRKSADAGPSQPRNLRILRSWLKDEPRNPRVLGYLGTEEAAMGNHKTAVRFYRRYLRERTGWDEERAQIHRKLAMSLVALDQPLKARTVALEALALLPDWPDTYLSLAQTTYSLGEHANAIKWAQRVLELGQPDSLLILNPLDYSLQPLLVLAGAHGALGRLDDAIAYAEQALNLVPDMPALRAHYEGWRTQAKRDYTAATFTGMAQQLCAHDEQLKALALLEQAVPYFATDHPDVVALRSQIRERVLPLLDSAGAAQHYEYATELGIPDLEVAARLPRAQMLRDGILEMAAERR